MSSSDSDLTDTELYIRQYDVKTTKRKMGNLFSEIEGSATANRQSKHAVSGSSSDEYDEKWGRPWKDDPKRRVEQTKKRPTLMKQWSDRDTKEYRAGYPGKKDNLKLKDNYLFYMNQLRSKPDGDFIDTLHTKWFGDYKQLERHHGYIQWLFPIREQGMNYQSQALQLHEAQSIMKNKEANARVIKSYRLMLDFYGMKLVDVETGALERADNWRERYHNLNTSSHNYLRITRILKSLGELGYERLKVPFLQFIMEEMFEKGNLKNCVRSCVNFWVQTVKDDTDRKRLQDHALQYVDDLDSCVFVKEK